MKLTVIIPVYNEASTLGTLLARVQAVPIDMEVLVVDDGSDDDTKRELQQAITDDVRNGQQAGVRGTPTIFVNGKRMKSRSLQSFQQMIDAELQKMTKAEGPDTP